MNTLPTLSGSEKQISWAETIRSMFFATAAKRNIPADVVELFESATSAGWWINEKPVATTPAGAIMSAFAGKLITVEKFKEISARYSLL